nr:hypothetical protein [Paracoccus saliphilus]
MFLVRTDCQIKLRGYRIDLGHVEGVLAAQPGVAQVYVDLDKGPPARLLAWVIFAPETPLTGLRGSWWDSCWDIWCRA